MFSYQTSVIRVFLYIKQHSILFLEKQAVGTNCSTRYFISSTLSFPLLFPNMLQNRKVFNLSNSSLFKKANLSPLFISPAPLATLHFKKEFRFQSNAVFVYDSNSSRNQNLSYFEHSKSKILILI